ncbi:MAG: hypothetical protein WCI18_15915 [Pseudomonadota bacterium]
MGVVLVGLILAPWKSDVGPGAFNLLRERFLMKFSMLVSLAVLAGLVSCGRTQENSAEAEKKAADQEKGTLALTCTPPVGLAGNAASVTGVLTLEMQPSHVYLAKGNLDVLIGGSTAKKVLDKKGIAVAGIYDRISTSPDRPAVEEYLNLGAVDVKIPLNIIANFKAPLYDVEYNGVSYLTECTYKVSL